MKVQYKKTILQRIDQEIDKAAGNLRTIDYIELTYEEWKELIAIAEKQTWYGFKNNGMGKALCNISEIYYNDVKLIQETRMV